jgi:plasmid maintenance system antidote protein VapI
MAKRKKASEVLRAAIRESGLTSYRIAKDCGIKPDQIDRFVSGERDLRLATAELIAERLGLELRKRDS